MPLSLSLPMSTTPRTILNDSCLPFRHPTDCCDLRTYAALYLRQQRCADVAWSSVRQCILTRRSTFFCALPRGNVARYHQTSVAIVATKAVHSIHRQLNRCMTSAETHSGGIWCIAAVITCSIRSGMITQRNCSPRANNWAVLHSSIRR